MEADDASDDERVCHGDSLAEKQIGETHDGSVGLPSDDNDIPQTRAFSRKEQRALRKAQAKPKRADGSDGSEADEDEDGQGQSSRRGIKAAQKPVSSAASKGARGRKRAPKAGSTDALAKRAKAKGDSVLGPGNSEDELDDEMGEELLHKKPAMCDSLARARSGALTDDLDEDMDEELVQKKPAMRPPASKKIPESKPEKISRKSKKHAGALKAEMPGEPANPAGTAGKEIAKAKPSSGEAKSTETTSGKASTSEAHKADLRKLLDTVDLAKLKSKAQGLVEKMPEYNCKTPTPILDENRGGYRAPLDSSDLDVCVCVCS